MLNQNMLEVSNMKITETFVADILKREYSQDFQKVYDNSPLLQYFGQENEGSSWKQQNEKKPSKYLCYLFNFVFLSK